MKLRITRSSAQGKKYTAVFHDNETRKTIHFGSANHEDYTTHHDKERRQRYLNRHRKNENWASPMSAGSLSRWILWGESTSIQQNIRKFKLKFNLQ